MNVIVNYKNTLFFDDFKFKCSVGKYGFTKNKIEGDKKTPKGFFEIGELFFRKDRCKKPMTKIKTLSIKRNMGWCNDTKSSKYNKLIKIPQKLNYEKLFRNDEKYNFIIPIEYNTKKPTKNKGSAIFLHLTKNYKPTAGCIAIKKNDFLVLLKLINKKTKIKII
tara:strand:+ start:1328 stop:1819 length:492 start_codon:yes stop_codon:yes gene_type:complete